MVSIISQVSEGSGKLSKTMDFPDCGNIFPRDLLGTKKKHTTFTITTHHQQPSQLDTHNSSWHVVRPHHLWHAFRLAQGSHVLTVQPARVFSHDQCGVFTFSHCLRAKWHSFMDYGSHNELSQLTRAIPGGSKDIIYNLEKGHSHGYGGNLWRDIKYKSSISVNNSRYRGVT